MNFLPVRHTHEDIDQLFSKVFQAIHRHAKPGLRNDKDSLQDKTVSTGIIKSDTVPTVHNQPQYVNTSICSS